MEGLDYHQFFNEERQPINNNNNPTISQMALNQEMKSTLSLTDTIPSVKVMGRTAIARYITSIPINNENNNMNNYDNTDRMLSYEETRVWQLINGKWKVVHLHRGPFHE